MICCTQPLNHMFSNSENDVFKSTQTQGATYQKKVIHLGERGLTLAPLAG